MSGSQRYLFVALAALLLAASSISAVKVGTRAHSKSLLRLTAASGLAVALAEPEQDSIDMHGEPACSAHHLGTCCPGGKPCPFDDGVCCAGGTHCCPGGTACYPVPDGITGKHFMRCVRPVERTDVVEAQQVDSFEPPPSTPCGCPKVPPCPQQDSCPAPPPCPCHQPTQLPEYVQPGYIDESREHHKAEIVYVAPGTIFPPQPTAAPTNAPTAAPTAAPTPAPTPEAPVDCEVGSWTDWSSCTVTCGNGTVTRTRVIKTEPQGTGKKCPALVEHKSCKVKLSCACKMSDWSKWTECSQTCGGDGVRHRTRTILSHPADANVTKECPPTKETAKCGRSPCPVDCVMSSFGSWGSCNATCGAYGVQTSTRKIITLGRHGGVECGDVNRTRACNRKPCTTDCVVGTWTSWGPCSASCDSGIKWRTRKVVTEQKGGGKKCPALRESMTCSLAKCDAKCTWTKWGNWSSCSKSCGGGFRSKERKVLTYPSLGDFACGNTQEIERCNELPCPTNCSVGEWTSWSSCSKNCGFEGVKHRTRPITADPKFGGHKCPEVVEYQPCNRVPCKVDCNESSWGNWSTCDAYCGSGISTRLRVVKFPSKNGGSSCGALQEYKVCNATEACPSDCKWGNWSSWSSCSHTCGGGTKSRSREQLGGMRGACGKLEESAPCNTEECPRACVVSSFGAWSSCSLSCGGGVAYREKNITKNALYGGTKCESLLETKTCNTAVKC